MPGCDIIIVGSEKKLAARYRDRARQFMLLEAGHIAQNILLQATSLGLGGVPIGAYDPNKARKICNLPEELEVFYMVSIGYPAEQKVSEAEQKKEQKMEEKKGKKAVLIVAASNFRDEELFRTKEQLEKVGSSDNYCKLEKRQNNRYARWNSRGSDSSECCVG